MDNKERHSIVYQRILKRKNERCDIGGKLLWYRSNKLHNNYSLASPACPFYYSRKNLPNKDFIYKYRTAINCFNFGIQVLIILIIMREECLCLTFGLLILQMWVENCFCRFGWGVVPAFICAQLLQHFVKEYPWNFTIQKSCLEKTNLKQDWN